MSSEVEIIQSWLREVFKTIENVDDVEIKEFNFGALERKHKYRESIKKEHEYKTLVSSSKSPDFK